MLDLPTGTGKTAALDAAVFHLALQAHTRQQQQLPPAGHGMSTKTYGHLHERTDLRFEPPAEARKRSRAVSSRIVVARSTDTSLPRRHPTRSLCSLTGVLWQAC